MCSWDVIFWNSDNALDYVPTSWANKTKTQYKWPADVEGIKIIISKCEDLEMPFDWRDATFKMTCYSLREAQHYSRKRKRESSLDTDDSKQTSAKKTATTRKRSSSSSDTDESKCKRPNFDYEDFSYIKNETSSETPSSSICSGSTPTIATNSTSTLTMQRIILEMNANIKMLIKKQDKLESLLTAKGIIFPEADEIFDILPLKTEDDVAKIEAYLKESGENFLKMANILGMIEAETYGQAISMCLKKIFSKEMALQYSGSGRKGKLNFSVLNICQCLHKAISNRFQYVTEYEIVKKISSCLAMTRDRDAGRMERN